MARELVKILLTARGINMSEGQPNQNDERIAFVLLIKSIMDQVDEIAVLLRSEQKALLSRQLLSETCSILSELTPIQEKLYFETLLALADSLGSSTIRSISTEYVESVVDAKRRFLATMRERLKVAV